MAIEKEVRCGVLKPGDMFIVNNSIRSSAFLPGTIGFIRHSTVTTSYNAVCNYTILIRRGKNGTPRMELKELYSPTFYSNDEGINKYLPTDIKEFVSIDKMPTELNMIKDSNLHFMGWSCAYTHYLYKLLSMYNMVGINNMWPETLTIILDLPIKFKSAPMTTINLFSCKNYRLKVLKSIRKVNVNLINADLAYKKSHVYLLIEQFIERLYNHGHIKDKAIKNKLGRMHSIYGQKRNKIRVLLEKRLNKLNFQE